jgi:hypothetical protein
MSQSERLTMYAHEDKSPGDANDGLHRPHHLAVDERPRQDFAVPLVDLPTIQESVAPDDQDSFAGFIEVEVTIVVVLGPIDAVEHAAAKWEPERFHVSIPAPDG